MPGGHTSDWVHARLSVDDQISLSGPYGAFLADPGHVGPAIHLAAGSGLAPIRALFEADLATDSHQPAVGEQAPVRDGGPATPTPV